MTRNALIKQSAMCTQERRQPIGLVSHQVQQQQQQQQQHVGLQATVPPSHSRSCSLAACSPPTHCFFQASAEVKPCPVSGGSHTHPAPPSVHLRAAPLAPPAYSPCRGRCQGHPHLSPARPALPPLWPPNPATCPNPRPSKGATATPAPWCAQCGAPRAFAPHHKPPPPRHSIPAQRGPCSPAHAAPGDLNQHITAAPKEVAAAAGKPCSAHQPHEQLAKLPEGARPTAWLRCPQQRGAHAPAPCAPPAAGIGKGGLFVYVCACACDCVCPWCVCVCMCAGLHVLEWGTADARLHCAPALGAFGCRGPQFSLRLNSGHGCTRPLVMEFEGWLRAPGPCTAEAECKPEAAQLHSLNSNRVHT